MKLSKNKCRILDWWCNKPLEKEGLGAIRLERLFRFAENWRGHLAEQDKLETIVLPCSKECQLLTDGTSIHTCWMVFAYSDQLYLHAIQKKTGNWVQGSATKTVSGLEHITCKERIKDIDLFSFEKRDLIVTYLIDNYQMWRYVEDGKSKWKKIKWHLLKMQQEKFHSYIWILFFTTGISKQFQVVQRAMNCPSLGTPESWLCKALCNLV